ncbi:MAG TPA: HlyD family efflux transporter periplasmic adaptor subunit [Candidatus Binatia bacterium]|nr:HlyD family efflux transporter periplasmic adaptor subunit [Candidatus Binatia bacterium]
MRRRLRDVLGGALLAVLAPACGRHAEPEGAAAPLRVQVVAARRGAITATLEVTGEVEGLRVLRLASPVAGRVAFLAARPGDRVAADEVLARVVPLESEAALAGFALLDEAGALGDDERRAVARLRRPPEGVPLRAPFAAVVADRARNPGEQVAPGDVLLELFDPQALTVLAQVPLDARARVRPGLAVEIAGEGMRTTGRVAALLAAVSPPALTVPVRVALPAPPARPLLHAPVRCRIVIARRRHALLVPRAALLGAAAGRGAVMVAAGGVAVRTPVRVGLESDAAVEVRRGLAEGDLVIVHGGYGLPDRTPVLPVRETP